MACPLASIASPAGNASLAAVAGPPSPEEPCAPEPATVEKAAWEFAGITTLYSFRSAFGSLGGLGYFAVVAAALLAAGAITVTRGDA